MKFSEYLKSKGINSDDIGTRKFRERAAEIRGQMPEDRGQPKTRDENPLEGRASSRPATAAATDPGVQKRKDQLWYLHQLLGNECLCGGVKKKRHSFCGRDFAALPHSLQQRLYLRIGEGYEEAFEESHKYLEEHVWR